MSSNAGKKLIETIQGVGTDTQKPASIGEAGAGQYRLTKPRNVDMPTVPIIDLSIQDIPFEGGELPSVGNSLRNDAIARARTRLGLDKNSAFYLPASNVTRDGNEYILKITKASLNKMLSTSNGITLPIESILVMDNLERIANNGVWFDGQGDRKGRVQIAGFDHLKTTVYIDGAPYLVDMRVKLVETVPGQGVDNVLYYYTPEEIITVERVGTVSPTGERRALTITSETMPTLNQSIPQTAPGVNPAEGASVDAKTGTSAPGDTTTSALAPKIKNQESATSVNRVLELARQATAMAEGEHGTPDWVPQKIRDALKPLTNLNLAAAKRKALGDLLGLSPEFQKNIPIALDKILADADDIARWESLELSPDLQEFIQPQLEEKKNDLQWLEERLAKLAGDDDTTGSVKEEFTGERKDGIIKKELLTPKEESAVLSYKSSESYKLNETLRDGGVLGQQQQQMMEELDRALPKLPIYQGQVYRRIGFDLQGEEALAAFLAECIPGEIVRYSAFTSASSSIDGYPISDKLTVMIVIQSESGRNLDGYGNNFEKEIIFPRGSRFFVERVETGLDGKPIIYMREVTENGAG